MFEDMKKNVSDYDDCDQIRDYLIKILNREAFDRAGLIYGMGHAVYAVSDPRERILSKYAERLSEEKGLQKEFRLYENTANIASELISQKRRIYKGVSPNVDFYSGFVYKMLGLPEELFTPIFAYRGLERSSP